MADPNEKSVFGGHMGRSEQIWHFWRPDGLSEQNLKIFANAISGPNILGQNLEILSEHIARIFGKFNMALSPIIGGPAAVYYKSGRKIEDNETV